MDERLTELISQLQQQIPETEEWRLALTPLVEDILRGRKICRHLPNQPLYGIYREIYQQIRQQLECDIAQQIHQYNPQKISARTWVNSLRSQACKTILDDAKLKQLAIEAQSHPPHSKLRHYALGELVEAIRLSGRLYHPPRGNISAQFYELIYDEAVNKTLAYVCLKIDNYDPERGEKRFMNWVNFRLDKVIGELKREESRDLPFPPGFENIVMQEPEERSNWAEILQKCIEEDAENIFKQTHIRHRPDANFANIALARFSGKSWQEISNNLGISLQTLSSFFNRKCETYRNYFRKYIDNY